MWINRGACQPVIQSLLRDRHSHGCHTMSAGQRLAIYMHVYVAVEMLLLYGKAILGASTANATSMR